LRTIRLLVTRAQPSRAVGVCARVRWVLAVSLALRIGFLQGWSGNFITGQRSEAWGEGELMWKYDLP